MNVWSKIFIWLFYLFAENGLPENLTWKDLSSITCDDDFNPQNPRSSSILASYILLRFPYSALQMLKDILVDMVWWISFL